MTHPRHPQASDQSNGREGNEFVCVREGDREGEADRKRKKMNGSTASVCDTFPEPKNREKQMFITERKVESRFLKIP